MGNGRRNEKTKSFNELHSSSNDVHDDFPITSRGWYLLLHLPLSKFYNHGFQNTYIRPRIKAQIDEELNHMKTCITATYNFTKVKQLKKQLNKRLHNVKLFSGRNAGKQNRR